MYKKYSLFLIFIFAISILSGCGYTTGALLPDYLKTIYVDDFKNKIDISTEPSDKRGYKLYRPGTENDITQEVIEQFIFDGHLRIVEKKDANLILTGELIDYYKQPLRYDKFDSVEEYRIIVAVDMKLKDIVEDKVMWEVDNFIGYETYRLTGTSAESEEEAREEAIDDLAEKIVEKVIEGW